MSLRFGRNVKYGGLVGFKRESALHVENCSLSDTVRLSVKRGSFYYLGRLLGNHNKVIFTGSDVEDKYVLQIRQTPSSDEYTTVTSLPECSKTYQMRQ
jgi:hypothetical protein